jgi:SAM-dependent methyltransferase
VSYAFGDSELAATRLGVVAEVFDRASRSFLLEADLGSPDLAIDLGCGPGYTTRLLAEVLRCNRIVGLDFSTEFVERASRSASGNRTFLVHDVTITPFPVGPADLLYCRLVLTHLTNPIDVIRRWATQVRPGGLLALEEVEWIETNSEVLRRYLDIVDRMLRSQSNALYIGPDLERASLPTQLEKRLSRVAEYPVAPADAARMFALNLRTWRERPFVRENLTPDEVSGLQRDLEALREAPPDEASIVWGLRQMVCERR